MTTLFLDLASHEPLMALASAEKTLAQVVMKDHRDETQLMPVLEKLMADASRSMSDLQRIACVTGPGGFMSLRVGITLANTLSYALNIPIAGMHASDVWAARVQHSEYIWLHSTKKDQLFIRGFGSFAKDWKEPQLVLLEDAKEKIVDQIEYVGELIPEHQTALSSAHQMKEVKSIAEILPSLVSSLDYKKGKIILPWYGRGM